MKRTISRFIGPLVLMVTGGLLGCGSYEDPNLHKDKRGVAIKLVQESPGEDRAYKVIDFANQRINMLKANGKAVTAQGWSADLIEGSKELYTVRFSYKEGNSTTVALWTANVVTKEVTPKNDTAHKFSW